MTDPLLARLDPRAFGDVARHVLDTPTYEWIRSGSGSGVRKRQRIRLPAVAAAPERPRRRLERLDENDPARGESIARRSSSARSVSSGRSTRTANWRWPVVPPGPAACSWSRSTPRRASRTSRPPSPSSRSGSSSTTGTTAMRWPASSPGPRRPGCKAIVPLVNTPIGGQPHVAQDRLPAARRREVRALRDVAGSARVEHVGVPVLAALGDLAADRAEGDHDRGRRGARRSMPGPRRSSSRTMAVASWRGRSPRSTRSPTC